MRFLYRIVLTMTILSAVVSAHAQSQRGIIAKHIESANTHDLAEKFTNNIDLSILNVDAVYSKTQAEMVLKRFFKDNAPVDFVIEHQGSAGTECRYVIGKLITTKSEYRVTYFLKSDGENTQIKQFRIEQY